MRKILILAANPKNTNKLRLDEEVREIHEGLQRSRIRDQFEIVSRWAVRPDDLRRALLDHEPQIVHFSGHGAGTEGLALEDNSGQMKLVSSDALARLFGLFEKQVQCVLLNACYSDIQADAIHQHIDYVIGMSEAIGDRAAIHFAVGFYDGLGANRSYTEAFQFGLTAIDLEGIPETATPKLKHPNPPSSKEPREENALPFPQSQKRSRIFISYKRDAIPDENLALEIYQQLGQSHDVFIDQSMEIGTRWAERIEAELQRSDFLITFLSHQSIGSEMVQGEVETAHRLWKESGKPTILPVRLNFRAPFTYPLSAYLDPINWAFWEKPEDTPQMLDDLKRAIAGQALSIDSDSAKRNLLNNSTAVDTATTIPQPSPYAQPSLLELPEGTMDLESQFYIERHSDQIALSTIQRQGVTITIKGPRQMGKSSLLNRTMQAARNAGKQVVFLDFQLFDAQVLRDSDRFFREFCTWLTDELEVEDQVDKYWQRAVSNAQRCSRYMSRHLLKSVQAPVVLAMDEVESIFDASFRSDFFSMLRSWHNSRAIQPLWKQLDLALITSTEPYQLIADLNQSPFNVGQIIELCDFTPEEVHDLNQRHGFPLNAKQEQKLLDLVKGQPFLVRKALYLVASKQLTIADLFAKATDDRGPFGAHLRYHLFRMNNKPELVNGLLQVIRRPSQLDEHIFFRLRGAGLVQRQGQQVIPRCPLYAAYFQEHLHD